MWVLGTKHSGLLQEQVPLSAEPSPQPPMLVYVFNLLSNSMPSHIRNDPKHFMFSRFLGLEKYEPNVAAQALVARLYRKRKVGRGGSHIYTI